jgi:hypothetical protein
VIPLRLDALPRLGQPVTKLSLVHPVTQPPGFLVYRFGNVAHPGMVSVEPGILRPRGRGWACPLQLIDLHRQLPRRGEKRAGSRLPAPGPYPAKHDQRRASRRHVLVHERFGRADGLLPRAPGELQPRPRDLEVGQVAEELRVLGELHAPGQVTLCPVEAAPVEEAPDQAHIRPAGVLDLTRLLGNPERLIHRGLAGRVAELPLGDADVRQGV